MKQMRASRRKSRSVCSGYQCTYECERPRGSVKGKCECLKVFLFCSPQRSKFSLQDPMASETECEAHSACLPFQGVTWAQEAGSWVCPQIFDPSTQILDLSALFSVCWSFFLSFFFFFDLFLFCFVFYLLSVTRLLPNSWPKDYC